MPSNKFLRSPLRWIHENVGLARVAYLAGGISLAAIWLAVTIAFAQVEVAYQKTNFEASRDFTSGLTGAVGDGNVWALQGSLVSLDPSARSLTVSWSPMVVQNGTVMPFASTNETRWEIGIFRDERLVPETANNSDYIMNTLQLATNNRLLRVDNETAVPIAVVGNNPWDCFSTDINLAQAVTNSAWREPLFGFPFDKWSGSIVFVANFNAWARNYSLPVSFGAEIDEAYLVDSIINWKITIDQDDSCDGIKDGTWQWLDPQGEGCQLTINFTAQRTNLVIFACVIAILVNWFSTIFIFVMTCEGVIMNRFQIIEGPQLLAVCFTALFALPSVRAILPGAPEFGAINLIGIVPNVIIISMCTTSIAVATLLHILEQKRYSNANFILKESDRRNLADMEANPKRERRNGVHY